MMRQEQRSFEKIKNPLQEGEEIYPAKDYSSSSSSTVTDLMEDDASSSSSGGVFELSELMAHLPIKRGLSKYYEGKSESFTSFGSLRSLGELAKKEKRNSYKRRKKVRRNHLFCSPRPTIAKKARNIVANVSLD